jgi:hypothetical protein
VAWIDGGSLRQSGVTHEVVSAYESEMARGEGNGRAERPVRQPECMGRFLRWEIERPRSGNPYTLSDLDPVTIKVTAEIRQPLKRARHGIALYTHEQQLLWAWTTKQMPMAPGEFEFRHTFPTLPLRPGPYNWLVTLFEDEHDVDWWYCVPDMIVAAESYQCGADEWNGVLNLQTQLQIRSTVTVAQENRSDDSVAPSGAS